MADADRRLRRLEEQVQVLDGSRGEGTRAAVRRGELAGLGAFAAPGAAGAAPTAAEFEALRGEVARLWAVLVG